MKKTIFILFSFFVFTRAWAQPEKFNITYIGPKAGLSSSNIRKIIQDQYGLTWIGTQDGLCRYDSKNFVYYNKSLRLPHQLGASDVRDMLIDTIKGLLWVSTSYGGLNAIDLKTGVVKTSIPQSFFEPLKNNLIKTIYLQGDTIFLGCERGLFLLNLSNQTLQKIQLTDDASSTYIDIINKLDNTKLLLLCRDKGIIVYDIRQHQVVQQIFPGNFSENKNISLQFFSSSISADGRICIVSTLGLHVLKWNNNRLAPSSILTGTRLKNKTPAISYRCAAFDKKNQLWIATNKGLALYKDEHLEDIIQNNKFEPENDWLSAVFSICVDSRNDLWLGCQNGLAYLRNSAPAFITYSYSEKLKVKIDHSYFLFPYNDSIIYSTAEEGLYRINKTLNEIQVIEKNKTYDYIFSDPYNRLIVSNSDGLFMLKDKNITPIAQTYPEFGPLANIRINSAIRLNDSCMALGSENGNGIVLWNFRDHRLQHYHTKSSDIQLRENIVNNLAILDKDRFAILSDATFSVFNNSKKELTELSLYATSEKKLLNIFFDLCQIKDTFFIACYGHGVIKLNKDLKVIGEITTSSGLSNNGVYKLLPWQDSVLFITTNNGLNAYSLKTGRIQQFFTEDGLHDNAFEETSGNISGKSIFAGGINGFTEIFPDRISKNTNPPILYFSNISIEQPGNKKSDTTNLSSTAFYIPSDVLQTTIFFSGVNYINPVRTIFSYKIEELHNEWIDLGNRNFINLIGIQPGSYHLLVKAANENGYWSEPKTLTLVFLPKWHQTWWFKLLLLLVAVAAVYILYRIRINQLKKEQDIRSKLASDLHDDLGSTLNSVKVYANLALLDRQKEHHLHKIKESIQEAITGVRDMIWVLDDKKDSFPDMLARISQFANPLCEVSGVEFTQDINDNARDYKLGREEKRNLYMMLKEAVNNATKYSAAGRIGIEVQVKKAKPEIRVSDNGVGFNTRSVTEGNGLKNMRRRAEQIDYLIGIASLPGEGTAIVLRKV